MEKLLEFMSCEHEEKVLRSSATTLLTLISTESAKYGIEFVRLEGVQARLVHHSSRLALPTDIFRRSFLDFGEPSLTWLYDAAA